MNSGNLYNWFTCLFYRDWNLENDIQSPLFMKNIPPAEDGFTAVILTYNRLSSLYQVIKSVAETPSLAKILVVWNNQNIEPPPLSEFPGMLYFYSFKITH